jgi:hypothetical protein
VRRAADQPRAENLKQTYSDSAALGLARFDDGPERTR